MWSQQSQRTRDASPPAFWSWPLLLCGCVHHLLAIWLHIGARILPTKSLTTRRPPAMSLILSRSHTGCVIRSFLVSFALLLSTNRAHRNTICSGLSCRWSSHTSSCRAVAVSSGRRAVTVLSRGSLRCFPWRGGVGFLPTSAAVAVLAHRFNTDTKRSQHDDTTRPQPDPYCAICGKA